MSIEIISNSQISNKRKLSDSNSQKYDYSKYKEEVIDTNNSGTNLTENFSTLKISNQAIESLLNDDGDGNNKKSANFAE